MIVDDSPFLEMYDCTNKYNNFRNVDELNEIINQNRLKDCSKNLINLNTNTIDIDLSNNLKGKLLLAVEDHGRIYYVNPSDAKKYEVTFANALYLFQRLALGITNVDLEQIPLTKNDWNSNISNRLKGKLLLQVEDRGRIWYVDMDGKRWEVTWANLMTLFESLALGITNENLDKIANEGIIDIDNVTLI